MEKKRVKLCIDYIWANSHSFLDCYFLDEKTDTISSQVRIETEGVPLPEISNVAIREIADSIREKAYRQGLKLVGKVNFLVSTREVFSDSELFPNIKKRLMIKYNKRDLSLMYPDYDVKNVYIETSHNDGTLGTVIFTTFCPAAIYDRLELLAKELKLSLGSVSSSNFSLTHRYEKYYREDLTHGVIIDIEKDYTLINLFINGTLVDDCFLEVGSKQLKAESSAVLDIRTKVLALIARHEYEIEKLPTSIIKICSSDALAAQTVHDYLKTTTKFDIGFTVANPLATSNFPTKYTFKKYKVNIFKRGLKRGFTLVEVVVSLAVFSILAGICLGAVVPMLGIVNRSRRESAMSHIVSDIAEVFRSSEDDTSFISNYYEINDISSTTAVPTTGNVFYYTGDFALTAEEGPYKLEYEVSDNSLTVKSFVKISTSQNYLTDPVSIIRISK